MSAALGLLRLQQVDNRLNQVEARLATIHDMLANDVELRAARAREKAAEAELHEAEHSRRLSEAEAQGQQIKIQQAESSLYGGKVHNPKELQDLQADVASLKKHLSSTEDLELEAMLSVEKAQAALQSAQEQVAQVEARLGGEHKQLFVEQESLLNVRKDLLTEREAAVSTVDTGILRKYSDLRLHRRGIAVAEVFENACNACGTTLTAALQQNARHAAELVFCPSCGRILFAG